MVKSDKSLADGMHRRLRRDILDGRLHAGAKLKLEALAANYSVGMSPLREALSRLIGESLVVSQSQRGFWVAPLSVEELEDLTQARLLVESEALNLSIRHGNSAWEGRLCAAFEALAGLEATPREPGCDMPFERRNAWEELNGRFHHALVDACGSPVLIKMRGWLYLQSERYRRVSVASSVTQRDIHAEHAAIFNAAVERNAPEACSLLRRHLFETCAAVRTQMFEGRTLTSVSQTNR